MLKKTHPIRKVCSDTRNWHGHGAHEVSRSCPPAFQERGTGISGDSWDAGVPGIWGAQERSGCSVLGGK